MGRKKIDIKLIENKNNLQVTFSKRRNGLSRKAFDLCIKYGTSIAILAFSPAGRPYPFAHPDIDSIIHRFIRTHNNEEPSNVHYPHVHNPLMDEYSRLVKELEEEKKLSLALAQRKKMPNSGGSGFWWDAEVGSLGSHELTSWVESVERLRENVAKRVGEVQKGSNQVEVGAPSSSPPLVDSDTINLAPLPESIDFLEHYQF
ncbi:agamous-like MADS-box protein AGL62 [Amborella trichopoda]|nr:agamous-like MADS-box protein AGL62 [Amborella trichopoda]|eukprot:XP_006850537.2 agamous-like MADS-box protein AGL62 [Amborella trichopoda]